MDWVSRTPDLFRDLGLRGLASRARARLRSSFPVTFNLVATSLLIPLLESESTVQRRGVTSRSRLFVRVIIASFPSKTDKDTLWRPNGMWSRILTLLSHSPSQKCWDAVHCQSNYSLVLEPRHCECISTPGSQRQSNREGSRRLN